MESIYVVGSNSFSGSHFVRLALAEGFRVVGVSRSPEPHPLFLPYLRPDESRPDNFSFLRADLNRDPDRIADAMERDRPAYVVNFAAQGMVAESWRHPEQWFRTNLIGHVALHDRLRGRNWLKKYVHVSTPEVYGSTGAGPIRENRVYRPSTPYAVSKAACDLSLAAFFQAYGFPVVTTRAANVYGPGQRLYRIIPRTILRLLDGGTLELHGGGLSTRCFAHIADVARATLALALRGEPGEIYHISSGRRLSIRELVFMIGGILGVDADKHVRATGDRLGKDMSYQLDDGKIRTRLGWRDEVDLDAGIRETAEWVKRNFAVLKTLPQDYRHKE